MAPDNDITAWNAKYIDAYYPVTVLQLSQRHTRYLSHEYQLRQCKLN